MGPIRPRIAIIDDEECVRKALRRLFVAEGMEAETFASGSEFMESLRTHLPDCVVLDLHVPGLDGLAIQKHLAAGVGLPVVVITGHDQPGAEERILAAGAAAYLLKPLDAPILLEAVAAAIGQAAPQAIMVEPDPR